MASPSPESPLYGSCECGGVRFEITQPFLRAGYCHCSRCRKLTGAISALNGRLPREGLRVLEGDGLLSVYRPPDGTLPAVFCATCGSTLFRGSWPEGEWIGIRFGALDADPGIRPDYHMFVDSRAQWLELPDDGLPRFPERRP